MNENRNRYLVSSIVLLVVVFLSIGYSAFQTTLFVGDVSAIVRPIVDIRVTGMSASSGTNGGVSTYEEYNVAALYLGASLPNPNSTVTYKVEVTNFGNVEMGILDITFDNDSLNDILTYEIQDYKLKEKICDSSNSCKNGVKKEFYITLKYKNADAFDKSTTFDIKLNVDFRRFYTITYVNIPNTYNYPTEIMHGDNLSVEFKRADGYRDSDIPTRLAVSLVTKDDPQGSNTEFDYEVYDNHGDNYQYDVPYDANYDDYYKMNGRLSINNVGGKLSKDVDGKVIVKGVYRFYEQILMDAFSTGIMYPQAANGKYEDATHCPATISASKTQSSFITDIPNVSEINSKYTILTDGSTTKKLCTAPDDYSLVTGKPSYYYRGSADNYVVFGGITWRIIRINGDGTIRLIYEGSDGTILGGSNTVAYKACSNGSSWCADDDLSRVDPTYVGYKTGTPWEQLNGSFNESYFNQDYYNRTHSNRGNDSDLKSAIDNWYVRSGLSSYDSFLVDGIFCNDRQIYDQSDIGPVLGINKQVEGGNSPLYDAGLGYGRISNAKSSLITHFPGTYRFLWGPRYTEGAVTGERPLESYPTLICAQQNDRYTVRETLSVGEKEIRGNGALTYPVATITADEAALAGFLTTTYFEKESSDNESFPGSGALNPDYPIGYGTFYGKYPMLGETYLSDVRFPTLTMTPSSYNAYYGVFTLFPNLKNGTSGTWMSSSSSVTNQRTGVRPVINIKMDTYVVKGDGTAENPYIFE